MRQGRHCWASDTINGAPLAVVCIRSPRCSEYPRPRRPGRGLRVVHDETQDDGDRTDWEGRRMKKATWQPGAFRPFRVFGDEPARGMLPPGVPPFTELAARLRGSRAEVLPASVGQSRHAAGRFLRLRGLPSSRWRGRVLSDHNYPRRVSLSLKGRTSIHLAEVGVLRRLSSPSLGLLRPTAHVGFEGPLVAGFAYPLRSALRV